MPDGASRTPLGIGTCILAASLAALVGLGLRLALPPSAPANGARAAFDEFERVRDSLPPDKVREVERIRRRLEQLP